MQYKNDRIVIALRNAKEAALYFDWVLPADPREYAAADPADRARGVIRTGELYDQVMRLGNNLVPPKLRLQRDDREHLGAEAYFYASAGYAQVDLREDNIPLSGTPLNRRSSAVSLARLLQSNSLGFSLYGRLPVADLTTTQSDPCLTLANIKIVDTSSLSWEHLFALRGDAESVKRLRRVRRFIFAEYEAKPASFVKEDLEERIEQYEETTRFWGMPTIEGLLRISLNAQTAAAIGLTLSATLFGVALPEAAATGATLALGRGLLEIGKRKREINLERDRSPIAYLAEAKKLEETSPD